MTTNPTPPATNRSWALFAVWTTAFLGLALWIAWRLDAFTLSETVSLNGESVTVPATFPLIDHPFHIARAYELLESLRSGEILRWVGSHQGGYPVEFYPLGVPWFEVLLWAVTLGQLSIEAVHALAIIAIFLLPAIGFLIVGRGDRMTPAVAFVATAIHVAVPGFWTNGGYTELVIWGLVTNVAGATVALIATGALARFVLAGERSMGVLAILASVAAAYTNQRALLAIGVAAVAAIIVALVWRGSGETWLPALKRVILRTLTVAGIAALLSAPVLIPLLQYQHLYFFLHYEEYATAGDFLTAMRQAVTSPLLAVMVAGVVLSIFLPGYRVMKTISLTLALYAGLTLAVSTFGIVEQLEAPRLMPYQRLLMVFLAGFAIVKVVEAVWEWAPRRLRPLGLATSSIVVGAAIIVNFVLPAPWVAEEDEGLTAAGTTATSEYAAFHEAIAAADAVTPDGSTMLVVGNNMGWWHQQLFAPLSTDGPLFYDDWLWYWHEHHPGPYEVTQGHFYPDPALALEREYLDTQGVGSVVVTSMDPVVGVDPRLAAQDSPDLQAVDTIGAWDVHMVEDAQPVITRGDVTPDSITLAEHAYAAEFAEGDGEIAIQRNWFPRWQATVNDESMNIRRTDDGYMAVEGEIPDGPVALEVSYAVTATDWIARLVALGGIVLTVLFAVRWRPVVPVSVSDDNRDST